MKSLKYIFIFIPLLFFTQSIRPTLAVKFTGGLSYGLKHEYYSTEAGMYFEPKRSLFLADNFLITAEYIYDYLIVFDKNRPLNQRETNFILPRIQMAKKFAEVEGYDFSVVYNIGYFTAFKRNDVAPWSYGGGVQISDNTLAAALKYEQINNYPHVSVTIYFKMWDLKK